MRSLAPVALVVLLVSGSAAAQTIAVQHSAEASPRSLGMFGVQLDAGVPQGAGASLVVRPLPALRLHVGAVHNGFSAGGRAGFTLAPLQTFVRPVLTVEAGYLPPGSGRFLASVIGPSARGLQFVDGVNYSFGTARLGLELGSSRRFSVSLQAGLSYLDGGLHSATIGGFSLEGMTLQSFIPSASLATTLFFG